MTTPTVEDVYNLLLMLGWERIVGVKSIFISPAPRNRRGERGLILVGGNSCQVSGNTKPLPPDEAYQWVIKEQQNAIRRRGG